jgi:hypothetical protein
MYSCNNVLLAEMGHMVFLINDNVHEAVLKPQDILSKYNSNNLRNGTKTVTPASK